MRTLNGRITTLVDPVPCDIQYICRPFTDVELCKTDDFRQFLSHFEQIILSRILAVDIYSSTF